MLPEADHYPAEFYLALHRGSPGDLEYYRERCQGGSPLLELGCGDGRVLSALRAVPKPSDPTHPQADHKPAPTPIVGIDHDPDMIAAAQKRSLGGVDLRCGDFLTLDWSCEGVCKYERIILPFCGLYCLSSHHDLQQLLQKVAQHLSDSGTFILDSYNADAFHEEGDDSPDSDDEPFEHPSIEVCGHAYRVFEQSRWQKATQTILVSYLHSAVDPEATTQAALPDELVTSIRHRYVLRSQLESAAANAELKIARAFGAFDKSSWAPDSHWSIFELQKA